LLTLSIAFLSKNKIRSHVSELQQAKGGTFVETRCTCYAHVVIIPIALYQLMSRCI